jgi:hypothetical protein
MCDNVLPGQNYRTPQGVAMDEYGAKVEPSVARENRRNSEKNLVQCHFVHQETHTNVPGIEPGPA